MISYVMICHSDGASTEQSDSRLCLRRFLTFCDHNSAATRVIFSVVGFPCYGPIL